MQTVWALYAPKTELDGPSPQAAEHLVALPIDVRSGTRLSELRRNGFMEYFKINEDGQVAEAPQRLVSRGDRYSVDDDRRSSRKFRRDYDSNANQQHRDALRSAPAPFFFPFFGGGGGGDYRAEEYRGPPRQQRAAPQRGQRRYVEPPEYEDRQRGGGFNGFFGGLRSSGF
jgi:hypothetical protein